MELLGGSPVELKVIHSKGEVKGGESIRFGP